MAAHVHGTCIVCHRRAIKWKGGKACKVCLALTAAEGTRERFGLHKPRANGDERFVATVNKLIVKGLNYKEIAKKLHCSHQSIKNRVSLLGKAGHVFETPRSRERYRRQPGEPKQPKAIRVNSNEHGGGKWGVTGCECELCLARFRESSAQWRKDNKEKERQYRANYQAKKQSQKRNG